MPAGSVAPDSAIFLIFFLDKMAERGEQKQLKLDDDLSFLTGLIELATKWDKLGDNLGVPAHQLDVIDMNNSGRRDKVQNCLRDMFSWWLCNGKETTVGKLIEAVHAVGGHSDIERKIKQKHGIDRVTHHSSSRTISESLNLPANVQRYCDDTKTRYLQQSVLPESDWPPSLGRQFITLALISQERSTVYHKSEDVIEQQRDYTRGDYDKILANKTKIELEAMFDKVVRRDDNKVISPLKMLIDGAPGVGKTTLSRKISHMWAKGELRTHKQYWLVLLLHLRESAISKAKTIDDFFYHEDSMLQLEVINFVKERSGDGVLIIFDGFDELSSYERSERSLFLDVCEGKVLPKCAVVITSRPYASRSIQELSSINRHIEVLGFTDKQVEMCIRQKLIDRDKAEELCTELKDRLDVASICQIPLNCSIVLYVYEQENYSLPRTLTELYELFILHSLKRFVKRTQKSRGAADSLEYLSRLPDPSSGHFKSLCDLAFKGLEEDKLVFSRDDMENVFLEKYQDFDMPVLDLMTSAKSYSSRGAKDTYSFLHLTIQEFLAAYWASHYLTDAERLSFFKKYLLNNRFRMVLLFLSGLTELNFHDTHTLFNKGSWVHDHIHICHLLYESGNHSIYKYVLENCVLSKSIEMSGSKFDALVVSHFIASSGCQWDLLQFKSEHMKIVHKVFSSCTLEGVSIRETLIIFSNLPPTEDMDPLSKIVEVSTAGEKSMWYDLRSGTCVATDSVEAYCKLLLMRHKLSACINIVMKVDSTTIILFTDLKLIDQLAQITRVVVRVMINVEKDCEFLMKRLSVTFLGPHAVHRKHYTIILDFSSLSSKLGHHHWKLIELLNKCCTQNHSVNYIILNPECINNAAYILSRLSQELSISTLAHFQCTVGDADQNPFQLEEFPAPRDFLNLISMHRSLQQLHLEFPGLLEVILSVLALLPLNLCYFIMQLCKG